MQASRVISRSFCWVAVSGRCVSAVSRCSSGSFYHTASFNSSHAVDKALSLAKVRAVEYESERKPSPIPASDEVRTVEFQQRLDVEADTAYQNIKRYQNRQRSDINNTEMARIIINETLLSSIYLQGEDCTYWVGDPLSRVPATAGGRSAFYIMCKYLEILVLVAKGPGSMVESSLGQLIAGMMLGREKSAREMEVELRICAERAGALMETVPSYGVLTTGTSWVFVKLWTDGGSRRVLVSREMYTDSLREPSKKEAIRDLKRVQVALAAIMDAQVSALDRAEKAAAIE